ncbi:MAG: hypothetical protein K5821_09710, partial [Nitrobacter sp.]
MAKRQLHRLTAKQAETISKPGRHGDGGNLFLVIGAGAARCQSACKFDPVSAFNFDPFARRGLRVALDSSELAGIAETRRAR